MGKLVFRVASDWQEVVRLRTEIEKLKQTLLSMDSNQSPDTFKKLNAQLGESSKKMNILIYDAAKAGATMENDFKKGIYDGEKAVNSLSEEIIKQKNIIRETQNDVSMLTEKYKKLGKYDPKRQSLSDELNRAKAALGEQKYTLGELQSQQALARLSTKALKDEYALFKDESKAVITTNEGVGVSFKKMLATIGGIAMLKQIASNVVSTAGMFQKYESVLTNALNGSSDKAKAYLSDINSFAAKTNFQLDELTDDFIKFVNRGVTPSMDAMKRMGDFTNTVAKPFDQLTEAILDINNPERWKEFGVRVQTEGNKVKLSFRDMTVECDRTVESVMKAVEQFGSMKGVEGSTEAISKTIEGQMSNLEDTITTALAEIGLANQDLISGSISAVDTIVKNYGIIGKSVLALVEIYGVYRAGLLINTIVEQGSVKSIWAKITATKAATIAQAAYNKVLAMNPYVAVGMAVVSLGVAVYTLADHTTYAEKTARSAAESMEKMKNASESLKNKIKELLSVIRDETSTQYKKAEAYLKLQGILPEVFKDMDIEKIKLIDKLSLLEKINKASDRREIVGAKTNVVLAQKEVDKINALIAADSQRGTYSGQYEIQLSDAKSKLEAAKKVVADIEKIQIEANKQKEKDDKKVDVKNKEYWTNQKKEAEAALNSIASYQKKLMDAGSFKGIDAAVVKSYKDNTKKLKEAEKELKVYESSSKQESDAEKQKKEREATLKAEAQRQEELLALRRQNQQDEINLMKDGSDKKMKQIELDYQKELDAIKKQEKDWSKEQGGKLTQEQSVEISTRYTNVEKKKDKNISDVQEEQIKEYKDLLSQYQDYIDKRLAIEKSFNDDIAILQEARKKAIEKGDSDEVAKIDRTIGKRTEVNDEDLFKLNVEQFKQDMDWEQVFGNLDKVSSDTLKKMKANLKDFISTQKDLSPENLKEFVDIIERIDEKVSERSPFESMSASFKSLKDATDAEREAQEAYNKALKEGTDEEKKNSKATLESAKDNKQKALSDATTALHNGVNEIGQYVEAGNQVIGIMETLGLNTPKWLEGTMAGFGEMLNGLGSIDLTKPMSIVTGSLQTIKGVLTSITSLGGIINWNGSNAKEVAETTERLTDSNERLKNAVDDLKDEMSKTGGWKAIDTAKQAREDQEKINKQTNQILQEQMGYHGSHHSNAYYWELGRKDYNSINKTLSSYARKNNKEASRVNNLDDIYKLTPEEMDYIRTYNVEMWKKMLEQGKYDKSDYWEQYADLAGKLEEINEALKETLTQTSFDGLRDSFIDSLMDMNKSAKDFADDFQEYMMRSILNAKISDLLDEDLQSFYDKWSDYAESDNELTESEQEMLRKEWNRITQKGLEIRDQVASFTGYDSSSDSSQDSTKKGFAAMSQDSADELNGRFTALQIAGEEIKSQNALQTQSLNILTVKADSILSVNTDTRNIADEIRTIQVNSYLELQEIRENTGAIVKPIQQMQKDIAEVKKNTSKL